jgi:poly [ADP-ribose] polymerase
VLKAEKPNRHELLDYSNQFYTLIPHSVGLDHLPLINNLEMLKAKTEMVDALLEIEIAYKTG